MTLSDIYIILKATGYPVAYSHFSEGNNNHLPAPPYICYLSTYSNNFKADNKVYAKADNIQIELYTTEKDLKAEKILEDVLDANDITYESIETYIESEKLFQKIYEVRLI